MDDFLRSETFGNESIGRLAGDIQIPSETFGELAHIGKGKRWGMMYKLAGNLKQSFHLVHNSLRPEKVNAHGLLYTWEGSDSSRS
jgi:Gly-Xaa carboxypeptidase